MNNKRFPFYLAGISLAAMLLDLFTKYLTVLYLPIGADGGTVLGLFHLTHHRNTGAAWSMMEGQTWFFLLVLALFLAGTVYAYRKRWLDKAAEWVCMAVIIGGALGNGYDRLFRNGEVVDMIQFEFWRSFPTFNVADCCITLGCAALFVYMLFFDRAPAKE